MNTDRRQLTIAFDAKRALLNFTGLGNYSRYAIETMAELYPDNRYLLCSHKFRPDERLKRLLALPNIEIVTPDTHTGKLMKGLWRLRGGLTRRLKRENVDLYHGLSNELPFDIANSGIPSVVTIHDLIFKTVPQNYKPLDRKLYDFKFRSAARNASRVVAISKRTKEDLERFYNTPAEKIDIVYQGCNPLFSEPINDDTLHEIRALYNLPERYFICVGTLEQRKNQLLIARALPMIYGDIKLVLVGRERNGYGTELRHLCEKLGVNDRIIHLTGVPTRHLPGLYRMAEFAAYPSVYEGFGLPVIEALSCGVPVIAATGSCLEEAGGKGALYVSPDSASEFANAAIMILDNASLRHSLIAHGAEHIAKFNRVDFANRLMDCYRRAMNR